MNSLAQGRRNFGKLLATGQTTSYVDYDDGYYEKGIVKAYTILTTGQYSGTTNITINSKTDAHSNNCVFDNNTGLMWSRYVSASVGAASDGLLPWTTNGNGEGIFSYCAVANAASLGGYTDWRIPNVNEMMSLLDYEAPTPLPNAVAFPSFPANNVWSSTTRPNSTTTAIAAGFAASLSAQLAKTATTYCILVRGG